MALVVLTIQMAWSQANTPVIRNSYDSNTLGVGVVDYNTGYSTTDYIAVIAGFKALAGEMDPDGNITQGIMTVQMAENSGNWHINADFRSVNSHEAWVVDVLFIDRHFSEGDVIKGDGTNTDIGGATTRLEGSDFVLGTNDGRTKGANTQQRALVHGENDDLIINFGGDFEGDTYIGSNLIMYDSIGLGTSNPEAILHVADNSLSPGARMVLIGDDAYFTDVDTENILGLYGMVNDSTAGLRLGSSGATIVGESSGRMVIKGDLYVEGSLSTGSGSRSAAQTADELASLYVELEALQQQNKVLAERVTALERSNVSPHEGPGLAIAAATLAQNYPNPFTEATTIAYQLPEGTEQATLYVYDMNGRQMLARTDLAGANEVKIEGGKLEAGMYYYSLVVDGKVLDTKRMLLTK